MRAAIVFLLFAVAAATPARADDRDEARREFAAGQAADQRKDWQGAIEHYLRANDLVPHPYAIFNIANDYERLGKLREAATWYERYLAAEPDSTDRERVQKLVRDLAARPAAITVRSVPSGARVTVDEIDVGATPYSGTIKGGYHRILVERDGRREQREITAEFGEPAIVDVTLRDQTGMLVLRGAPTHALVEIDHAPAGRALQRRTLPAGEHAIRVTADGFAPYETTAVVTPNAVATVDVEMQRNLDGTGGPGATNTRRGGYLLGGAAGADTRGGGALYMVELGFNFGQFDLSLRIGSTIGLNTLDFLGRWALTDGRLAPFLAFGYSYTATSPDTKVSDSSTSGYQAGAGVRYQLSRSDHLITSLLLEGGVRYYVGISSGTAGETTNVLAVPIMTSLQIVYR